FQLIFVVEAERNATDDVVRRVLAGTIADHVLPQRHHGDGRDKESHRHPECLERPIRAQLREPPRTGIGPVLADLSSPRAASSGEKHHWLSAPPYALTMFWTSRWR